jgi:light-regulated signal transduction histidine kinase (bacteriophytochrome)
VKPAAIHLPALSILLVEDDEAARKLLTTVIGKKMPELVIFSAADGRSGLASFKQHSPGLIITDIAMPGMDGISMAAEIKALMPDAVIIAVTAYTDTQDLLKAIEIGIDHYLLKPLSMEKLFAFIDKVVASKAEIWNRARSEEALRLNEERHKNELRLTNNLLEQRVRERTADLELALREQESFSYSISHDLRAPLRHINSYCAMLMEDYDENLTGEMRGYLDRVCAASSTMGKLIDHLLELSRMSRTEIKPEAVDLSKMAQQILGMYQETDSQRCVEIFVEENAVVLGDRIMLRQLLENLLGNAWKYTSKKHLTRIEFGMSRLDGEEAYFIKDNGVGFDMAYQERLFNPFERLHGSEFDGDGIGLMVAQRVIRRHGGNIWAVGRVDEGATFYFTLPVYY